ncbi:MAG: hypothetical protein HYZ85_04225 [Candidatus Omnitrophica bacterium]|nr:hypothetical protein [Candidatus Omnitrophota bacterium]
MDETTLMLNHSDEFNFYSEVNPKGEHLNLNVSTEIIEELTFRLESFLRENFGTVDGPRPAKKFRIEYLLSLPVEKKKIFEDLLGEIMGHSACFDYFSENE